MPNNNPKQNKQEFTFAPEFQKNFKPGTLDTFGEEGIVHSSFGNSDFGDSKYDVDTTPSEFITNNDYQYLRGEKQTYADKAANGIGRALIKTGTRTLNGIVSPLYGAVSALYNQDASKIWDNKITEMSADIESSLDEALPLYKTKKEEDAHGLNKLLYANTLYGDVLDGISYSASALGSGYTTGALLNLAGKLSVVNKAGEFLNGLKTIQKADDLLAHVNKYEGMVKVIDGTKKGLQLYSSASTEASIEGYQAANEWYDSMKNELTMGGMRELTPEEDARLKELRKQVGNTTFAFNLPVIMADNAISFGRAMLGNKVTNDIVGAAERTAMTDGVYSQAKQSLVTRLADKTYGVRKFGVPMVSEGNQEMLQYAVQKGSQDYYNKKYYNPTADDFISSMKQGLYEAYGTKEGWDQGLIGALSSGIFSNATVLKTEGVKGFKNPNNDEAVNKAVEYLNSVNGTQAYKDLYQAYVRHSNLADEQDAALENKDTFNYYNATSDMFLNYVTSRIKTGKINDLRTDLESFKKITPEQLKQQGIELSDSELTGHKQSVIDYVQTRLAKVADIEKLHNNINENYPTAPEGVKERLLHAAWSLDDSNKRIKELTENASILARKSNSTADISLINILHDYANLPKDNRQSAKDAIANNPLASPHIQDELLAKLKDVDLLIDRRQEFIEAYRELKEPTKQAEVAEQDKAFESQVEEVLSKPTPTEETGETKEQAEEVLTTKAEKPKPTNQPFELDLNDLADISSGELPQFDNEGNEIVSTPEVETTEKTPISEVISQDTSEAGYSTIALDYLFTGGKDVIQSTDYLLQALVGGFPKAGDEINNIRNKYANKLGNLKDDINSQAYIQTMQEIKDVILKNYNNLKALEIFDKILKNPTGFTTKEGQKVSIDLDNLNETEEPIARAKTPTNNNPREIYPGLNNKNKRNEYNLPSGDTIRSIINGYLDKGIDINTKISLRHFVNSAGKDGAIISINTEDGAWIDLGNLSSYTKDDLTNDVISILTKEGKTLTPQDLGIYFSMTEKTIQLEDKDTKQPNLSELTTDVRVNGEYLIYDRNNGGWANPNYDDSNLEIPVDFEEVDTFNKAELNNSRYVLLVPNGNKYSYVRLRNELLSPKDITSLFNEFKDKSIEFKNNKDLTVDEINSFNEAIESQLFIALNPSLKVGQSLVDGSELKFKVGKFGKFQAELRYKVGKDYKSITEYFNITDVKDVDSLLALVNKEFKDKHETDLNLKPNDLQQHVDLDKPETFRAATKPNVFNPNYGNQLVFNELNIEEQPTLVQVTKAAEPQVQDNTLNEDTEEEEDDFDIDNIVYSIGEDKINYTYKAVDKILNNKSKVNGWLKQIKDKSQFWDKVQKDLAIPKDQTDLLKMVNGNTVDEIITNFLADYSYVVKVDTTKRGGISETPEWMDEELPDVNSDFYSNLTVPGGTNYTENEISTPGITPSIKGHAQFATDKGIGWFRSDEQVINQKQRKQDPTEDEFFNENNLFRGGESTKTRRVLEVQSDLFQKGRDKTQLDKTDEGFDIDNIGNKFEQFTIDGVKYVGLNGHYSLEDSNDLFENVEKTITKEEFLNKFKEYRKSNPIDNTKNQFLQLLNKDSNWVTFFVKSIIQDSAKKGYEKVLFPLGDTASKVEGHTTLEEFIKQKENRIKTLENDLIKLDPNSALEKDHNVSKSWNNEITQLKEELEKVKTEGISKLKPIYDFYENKVTNILSKVYGKSNVKQVTDEYGNTWNEITIDNVRDLSDLAFKTNNVESVDAISQSEIEFIKKILPSFIDIQDIEIIIKNLKVNGIPYGAFRKNIIYLNSKAKKGTGYHEAFHAVFRTVLSEQDIQKYLKAAKNEFKGDLKASKENLLLTNPANSNLTDSQLEELVYEEYMADKFADYMLNKSDKSIGATLKQLFRKIIELFKGLFNNTDSTTVLFDKINAGAFVNSTFQFNRFNGNDTAFKLLPRSYSKTVGLQYFTSTESRLLINTLTAKVHNAILNGDTRTRTEIFDDLAKQRFDELENDGIAWVDKLSEKGETQLAEKVASAIEDQQFVLDPESLKGKALGLLKSEVLKRLELFNYVEKDIDSSEDAEDGDDMIDNDANEIKEQLGSKDAWLTGGHDSLSKTIKQYIAFTTYTKLDPLTGKQTEFGVDEVTLYNGLTRILSDTKEDNMLNKLSLVAESNDNIKAFLDRISKEMNITKNEDGTYNIDNINPEAYNTFRLFISNFKKSKASQLMTTYATGNAEEYKVFNANTNDPKKVSRDQWFNALHYIKENNKLTPKQLGDYVKDANKALVIGNNPKELKFLTENDLNTQATDLVRNLSKIGIEISKVYAKYSIVRAKQDAVNEYNAKNDNKILPTSVISDKSINLLSLYNVTPITSELLVGNNGFNLSALLAKNENPYNSDNDINSKLEEIADSNSYFDESIGNSSFTNAEGNRVYEIINLSYVLDKVNDFKSDAYWNKVRTGKGLTEVESKNFKFISGNYLLNKHYDALKRIELNIINGFRNEADTEGITFGSYDQRTYFANALALFGKTTKGGLVRYIFRQNEASSTAYTATGPKINALNVKGGLTTEVINAFYDKFLSEFNRITIEYADKDNKDRQLIKGYNDSTEKGRAYRFAEFSYLAFINPKLYNDLTRMAQEGNLEELKANEGKVKNAIEYYLLQEGFARFKEQLDLIGFNTKDNSFVSKNLIAEYGDMDKALKEFYINDYLMSSSINELLDGDYALSRASKGFKTITIDGIEVEVPKVAYGIDISKRNKGGMASGPDYGKGNHKVTYIKDINGYIVTNSVDGSFIRVTEQDGRLIGDNGVEYTKDDVSAITTNDAQSYASQYHHIFGSMRLGRLDKRAMNIYKNLIQFTKRDAEGNIIKNINIPEVDQEYLEKSMASANSKKTITFDGIAGIYHKLSEAGLWRSSISYIADEDVDTFVEYTTAISDLLFKDRTDGKLYKDLVSELADLYKPNPGMEALHSLANKMDKASIDQAITESASKGATVKPQDMFTGDLDASSTLVRNNAKRLQTETPTGKDLITAGSQLINLIDTELDDTYEIEGYGTLGDIRDRYRTLMSESRDNSFKQAMKYIEMFADGSIDITKLREKLVRSLEANNADESMMELFDKGYNLNLSAIIDKAEQIVLAHFSKGVLNQKVNGTKVSLMSDAGITVVRNEDGSVVGFHEVARNPEKYKDYNKSSLRYNVKDDKGRRFSECMLSERILTKHGLKLGDTLKYEDIKMYPELFEAIGYRIPTQGHQSMMALKIVGLLPNYYEGVGIFPMEIIYLSGADFDIDSEFIQLPQFWIRDGRPVAYGTEKTDKDKLKALKYYNLNYNKEFKAEYKKQLKAVVEPNKKLIYESVAKLFDIPTDIKGLQTYKTNAEINNEALRLMIVMLTNDYVQNNSANSGTTTDPMAEVSDKINELLEIGSLNSKYKVPDDYKSASDINGKSISNTKNSAGKAGIGIVANKVQQLTSTFKANNGQGLSLRDNAFKWSIGGKESNGYMTKVDNNRVMDIMGVLLNVMTDNAKDPIAGNMNLSLTLLNGYTEFLAQGADKYDAALVLNQPSVQLYGKLKQIPNYTLKNNDEESLKNAHKIFKAAIAKIVYGSYNKATLDNLETKIQNDFGIDLNNPKSINLEVKQMEGVLKNDASIMNTDTYKLLQVNALVQFRELEKQADDISNLNTYLTLNQGLDISFAELRHKLEKAHEKLSTKLNPKVHVDILPLVSKDSLTYGNIKRATEVLKLGGKIFIEQSNLFRQASKGLDYSLNDSYLNKKKNVKKVSRDFLSYVSTASFKKYLNDIIANEPNETKRKEAETKLKGLNYALVYPELGTTIAEQLNTLKNSDKSYIRNNALIKYLKPVSKQDDKKGIDFIDGKSFAKESPETISTLVDGFKELMFNTDDATVQQFAINLFNYSIVKDNLQFKFGSIMKYLAPGMFHTYSSTLDSINNALNTNDNNSLSDFGRMGYEFRKLFVTYIANKKNVTKYKSIVNKDFTTIEGNTVKFNLGSIMNDEKLIKNANDIFDNHINSEGKYEGFDFPQFYTFNGNVYELKEVNGFPHNPSDALGNGYSATYNKLEYHGNTNVSPYSNNTYEDAIRTDKQIADFNKPVKAKEASKPDIIKNNPFDLVDSSDLINFVNISITNDYDTFTSDELGLNDDLTTDDFKC